MHTMTRMGFAMATVLVATSGPGCRPGGNTATNEPNYIYVVSSDPLCGSTGAFLDQAIKIRFNTGIDPNSVSANTVKIMDAGGADVPGNYATQWDTVTFTANAFFFSNSSYTIRVKGIGSAPFSLLSLAGDTLLSDFFCSFTSGTQFVFDATPPDIVAIQVSGSTSNGTGSQLLNVPFCRGNATGGGASTTPPCTPTNGPSNVSPMTSILLDFNEGMAATSFAATGTFATSSVLLWSGSYGTGTPVACGFWLYPGGRRVVVLPPQTGLTTGTTYWLQITGLVTDDSSNPGPNALAGADIIANFTTRNTFLTDVTAPPVNSPIMEDFSTTNGSAAGNQASGGGMDTLATTAFWDIAATGGPTNGALKSNLFGLIAGDGSDGSIIVTGNFSLDTTGRPLGWNYTSFTVAPNGVLAFTGTNPGIIRSQGAVNLQGNIILGRWPAAVAGAPVPDSVDGANCPAYSRPPGLGGTGRAGGGPGGAGAGTPGSVAPSGQGLGGGSGGVSGDPENTPQVIPGGGGGGGFTTNGTGGTPTATGGPGGVLYPASNPTLLVPLMGGSGGGGGGMDDDSPTSNNGDGTANFANDEGGAGAGAGGGALRLSSGGNITVSGAIWANGGNGGHVCVGATNNAFCPPSIGFGLIQSSGAGGAGSGGAILIQSGGQLTVTGTGTLSANFGQGGQNYWFGGGTGGQGSVGRIRLEDVTGSPTTTGATLIPGIGSGATAAGLNLSSIGQTLWYDTGVHDPDFLSAGAQQPLISDATNPTAQANGGDITVEVMGADADGTGKPDPNTFTNWVTIYSHADGSAPASSFNNMDTLAFGTNGLANFVDRHRFLRLRVTFRNTTAAPTVLGDPWVYDVTISFRN